MSPVLQHPILLWTKLDILEKDLTLGHLKRN